MNLLHPVRKWIARKPTSESNWLSGLEITQADIDGELLHPDAAPETAGLQPVTIAWYEEEIRA
ncbi:hypothetical protein D3C87_946230 [compost metagenome]